MSIYARNNRGGNSHLRILAAQSRSPLSENGRLRLSGDTARDRQALPVAGNPSFGNLKPNRIEIRLYGRITDMVKAAAKRDPIIDVALQQRVE
jgi:hypothetical protein